MMEKIKVTYLQTEMFSSGLYNGDWDNCVVESRTWGMVSILAPVERGVEMQAEDREEEK